MLVTNFTAVQAIASQAIRRNEALCVAIKVQDCSVPLIQLIPTEAVTSCIKELNDHYNVDCAVVGQYCHTTKILGVTRARTFDECMNNINQILGGLIL